MSSLMTYPELQALMSDGWEQLVAPEDVKGRADSIRAQLAAVKLLFTALQRSI